MQSKPVVIYLAIILIETHRINSHMATRCYSGDVLQLLRRSTALRHSEKRRKFKSIGRQPVDCDRPVSLCVNQSRSQCIQH